MVRTQTRTTSKLAGDDGAASNYISDDKRRVCTVVTGAPPHRCTAPGFSHINWSAAPRLVSCTLLLRLQIVTVTPLYGRSGCSCCWTIIFSYPQQTVHSRWERKMCQHAAAAAASWCQYTTIAMIWRHHTVINTITFQRGNPTCGRQKKTNIKSSSVWRFLFFTIFQSKLKWNVL